MTARRRDQSRRPVVGLRFAENYPAGIRSDFGNAGSSLSQGWPRMPYVTISGVKRPGSSRLAAWTAIGSGIAANVT
jgi:hypothetical protein